MSLEEKRRELQKSLDALKSPKERNRMGQFATPYPLASSIVKYVKQNIKLPDNINFLEPSMGTGVFFSSLLSELRIDTAIGFEIDSHYGVPAQKLWANKSITIKIDDFLSVKPERYCNLIIANPPYTRHHHLSPEIKRQLARKVGESFGIRISGLAGLYCYFLILSTLWLDDSGISVWLIPTEFMDVNYGEALRVFLTSCVDLISIHKYDSSELQFSDALVSSCVVIFRNKRQQSEKVILTTGSDINSPDIARSVYKSELRTCNKWSNLFASPQITEAENKVPLMHYFTVSRGISTGNNKFFILDKNSLSHNPIPEQFLKPILPSPRLLNSDIVNEEIFNKCGQYLFWCSLPIKTLESDYPEVAAYIHEAESCDIDKSYICSRRSPWYLTEKRDPAPFYLTYMGRGDNPSRMFRFILNESGAIVTNSYLILYPKNEYIKDFDNPEIRKKVWEILCSIPKESIMRCGRCYGGGLYKIEPKELLNVKIPSLDSLFQLSPKSLFD